MGSHESIVVVGGSGRGKTTAVKAVRGVEYSDTLIVPKRYVAPSLRLYNEDDKEENIFLSVEEFEARLELSEEDEHGISPYWRRPLSNAAHQLYGFEAIRATDSRLRVYSANNCFPRSPNEAAKKVLASALVVLMVCDSEEARSRLKERSSDISPEERNARVADVGEDVLDMGYDVTIIDTTAMSTEACQTAFRRLVRVVLADER